MKKTLFFGGKLHDLNCDLKAEIQRILDTVLKNGFIVKNVIIESHEASITIMRKIKKYYKPNEDCANLDDTVIFSGHLEKSDVMISIPLHPFCNQFNYHFQISNLLEAYNELMKSLGGTKLKGLEIESSEEEVTYRFYY